MKKGKGVDFEQAICELEDIVFKLENGNLTLDQSVEFFQRGIELSKQCSKKLDEVERKITVLIQNEDGELVEKAVSDEFSK